MKKLALILFLLICVAGGAAAFMYQRVRNPYRGYTETEQFVDIPSGSGTKAIGEHLVAAGRGASILPQTAVPPGLAGLRTVTIAGMPPRRLALVTARHAYLSLADRAVRDSVRRLVTIHRGD